MMLRRFITVAFFEYKLINDIFDKEYQAVDPQNIHDNIVFVVQAETKQRPPYQYEIFHIIEKEDTYPINLFECFQAVQP